ncbi:MAG: cellulase family glycosylhydrolase [Lentisphaeria bacterium]
MTTFIRVKLMAIVFIITILCMAVQGASIQSRIDISGVRAGAKANRPVTIIFQSNALPKITVVGFGDSITQAVTRMPDINKRWLKILEKNLSTAFPQYSFNVINSGIGGNSAREAMARFDKDVLAYNPDYVLLQFGGNNNDPKNPSRRVPPDEFNSLLKKFKDSLPSKTRVIVITFPPVIKEKHIYWKTPEYRDYIEQSVATMGGEKFRELTRNFADENGFPLYDLGRELTNRGRIDGSDKYTLDDGVHLTAAGNQVLADGIFDLMKNMLQVKPQQSTPLVAGNLVFRSDFENPVGRAKWTTASFASWVKDGPNGRTVLKISVPGGEKTGRHMVKIPLDLSRYQGRKLWLKCRAKALNVTQAPQPYNGVKYRLHYQTPYNNYDQNQNNVYGTFDWKELSFVASIDEDAKNAELYLGLEMSAGEVWFDDLRVEMLKDHPPVCRPAPMLNPPAVFKGHDLPRLRGAMLPNSIKEEDLRDLAKGWNANLVRYQMTQKWDDPIALDPIKYDAWLEEKMAALDRLLNFALIYGFKVVIDLHSPPGGHYEDSSLRMFYEKPYQDHFVKVWERISRRYKGHPAIWGYDLVNEPIEIQPAPLELNYHATQTRAAKAIRAIDPQTPIIVEVLEWDSPRGFAEMMPVLVPNVIYEVHMYEPGVFTHQGVNNEVTGIAYPGMIRGKRYDADKLKAILKPVRDFQLAYNVHIYVGEFSAVRWAPGAAQYLSDVITIFESYGWDWSYHAFREWPGWSVEHADQPVNKNLHISAATTARKKALLSWFAKNSKPVYHDAEKWIKDVPAANKAPAK